MKKMKKVVCLALAALLVFGVFSGCSNKKTVSSDETVKLKWVFGGPGNLADSERVWQVFNEKLADYLPNTEVEFTCIPHADYAEKWRLMSASQEIVDIAWVSWALNFADEVAKGSYLDMTELVAEYGQDMTKELPDWLLKLTTIDGKIYAIPNYQMMYNPVGFSVEKRHIDNGWLDLAKAEEVLQLDRPWVKEDFKVFEEYFLKVLNSEEDVKYVSNEFLSRTVQRIGFPAEDFETIVCNAVIKTGDETCTVYDKLTDFPGQEASYELLNDWYKKGIIREDKLENPSEKEGDYLLWWTTTLKGAKETLNTKFGKEMEIVNLRSIPYIGHTSSPTNTAIAATSQHPERAMQLLNLMNCSKGAELLNLLTYGIEGEHYNKISDDRIEWLGEALPGSSNNKYGYQNWALGNALVTYTTQNDPEGWNEYIDQEINKNAIMSPLAGFTLDQKPIKLEISQYNAVMQEYSYLDSGLIENYEEVLNERNEKLRAAGSEKIVEEVRRQVTEWMKNNK